MKITNKIVVLAGEIASIAISVTVIDFSIRMMIPEETRENSKSKIKGFVRKTAKKAIKFSKEIIEE